MLLGDHKDQIAVFNAKIREEEKNHSQGKKKSNGGIIITQTRILVFPVINMREPDTVTGYILKYGYNPIMLEKEPIESFEKKYTIDPKSGDPVPR